MAADWRETELGNVITLQRGFDLPAQERTLGSVPIISSSGLSGRHAEAMVPAPGVVTGRYGTIGEVFYIEQDFWPLNTTLFVKDFKGNDPHFVFYLLQTVDFYSCSDKSSVPGVNRNHLHRLHVSVPASIAEQKTIAGILGALDDKIALNQRINETLEAMARAIFKCWFVAFDPVRAKAKGRQPSGIDAATAALFPTSFQDSSLGKIPMGWLVRSLGEVTSYLNRGISPSYVEEGGILVFNQKCVRGGHVDASEARRHDMHKQAIEGRTLKVGDILVNSTGVGTLGRVGQLLVLREDAIVDSHVTVVRANGKDVSANFLGIALSGREEEIEAFGEGTTGQTELSRARLASLLLTVPPPQVVAEFDKFSGPIRQQVRVNSEESETLAAIRDALLPKLISGEIRLQDAGKLLEVHT